MGIANCVNNIYVCICNFLHLHLKKTRANSSKQKKKTDEKMSKIYTSENCLVAGGCDIANQCCSVV